MSSKLAQLHVNIIAPSDLLTEDRRLAIYRRFGLLAGNGVYISSRCYFEHPDLSNICLGDRVFLNHFCLLENGESIYIGGNTRIGPNCQILTTTHGKGFPVCSRGAVRSPVTIGRDCWLGANVLVLPGVTVGDRCIIGAGALVNRDLPSDGVYVGVPARKIADHPATVGTMGAIERVSNYVPS